MVGTKIIGVVEERVSSKGNPYKCIVFKITDTYSKVVLLKDIELELLKLNNNMGK